MYWSLNIGVSEVEFDLFEMGVHVDNQAVLAIDQVWHNGVETRGVNFGLVACNFDFISLDWYTDNDEVL